MIYFSILLGLNYVLMNAIHRIIIICLYALLHIIIVIIYIVNPFLDACAYVHVQLCIHITLAYAQSLTDCETLHISVPVTVL